MKNKKYFVFVPENSSYKAHQKLFDTFAKAKAFKVKLGQEKGIFKCKVISSQALPRFIINAQAINKKITSLNRQIYELEVAEVSKEKEIVTDLKLQKLNNSLKYWRSRRINIDPFKVALNKFKAS